MKINFKLLAGVLVLLLAVNAKAKTVRATEMGREIWSQISSGDKSELIVEFRLGDELPVSFSAEGDFLETSRTGVSYVLIKRNFWLKLTGNQVEMSLDGTTYKPIQDAIKGSFSAGAGSGSGSANAINLALSAYIK